MKIFTVLSCLIALSACSAFARLGSHDLSLQDEGKAAQLDDPARMNNDIIDTNPARFETSSPNSECMYSIYVETGMDEEDGTDARVTLVLGNADGVTIEVSDLASWGQKGPNYDYFESGSSDNFVGRRECLRGGPCSILLRTDGPSKKSGWFVVSVRVNQLGISNWYDHTFDLYQTIDENEPSTFRNDCSCRSAMAA